MDNNGSKVTENDLCYCGSEKKFKNCHMKMEQDYYPKESFLAKVIEVEDNMLITQLPENIHIGRVDVSYRNPVPWDDELSRILEPLDKVKLTNANKWDSLLDQRKNKLSHKLLILRQHIEDFKQIENLSYEEYIHGIAGNTTVNKIFENPLLISNTESFLFQAKSTLDIFGQLIGIAFRFSVHSYSNGGQKIIDKLKSADYDKYRVDTESLIQILEDSKPWINKLVQMRNDVTHYSDLPGLSCFMFRKIKTGETKAIVYYPSLSDGERVSKYMDSVWSDLAKLISTSLPIIVRIGMMRR